MTAAPPRRRSSGRRRRWPWGWIAFAALVVGAALVLADQMTARHQKQVIDERRQARLRLDRMTLYYLRADIVDVVHTPEGKYRATIYMENLFPEHDMYVMVPSLRAFAQSGPQWKEIPVIEAKTRGPAAGTVLKLTERIVFEREFEIPTGDYSELLPGYYHIQFYNTMLVADQAEPKDDVSERTDYYFIHLLPFGTDVAEVARRNKFPNDKVPLYIPMPPH